jgi:hypothetical protein
MRNVGVSLEWQLNDMKPVPDEDCVSLLPDVAERAKEVIPVQHRSRVIHASPLVDFTHLLCPSAAREILTFARSHNAHCLTSF